MGVAMGSHEVKSREVFSCGMLIWCSAVVCLCFNLAWLGRISRCYLYRSRERTPEEGMLIIFKLSTLV